MVVNKFLYTLDVASCRNCGMVLIAITARGEVRQKVGGWKFLKTAAEMREEL